MLTRRYVVLRTFLPVDAGEGKGRHVAGGSTDQQSVVGPPAQDGGRAAPAVARNAAGRIGRRVATLIYGLAVLYMTAVGFYSIPRAVFWPDANLAATQALAPAADGATAAGICGDGLRALRAELLAEAARRDGEPATAETSDRRWLAGWDARYFVLEEPCSADGRRPYAVLGTLRHRIEDALRRHDREQAPLLRSLAAGLATLDSHATESPSATPR